MSRPKGETVAEEDSYVMSGERKGSGVERKQRESQGYGRSVTNQGCKERKNGKTAE